MFNYYFDENRDGHADTVKLFEAIGRNEYEAYTSDYVVAELEEAPEPKRDMMLSLIEKYRVTVLPITDESDRMADLYLIGEIIPPKFRYDGAHIAIASINGLDCILSYNFQHINKQKTKILTERVNMSEGYKKVVICTAKEVLSGDE